MCAFSFAPSSEHLSELKSSPDVAQRHYLRARKQEEEVYKKTFKPEFLRREPFYHFNRKRNMSVFSDTVFYFFIKANLYLTFNVMIKGPVLFL